MTNKQLVKIKIFRKFLLGKINELSVEQLNTIPVGFNHNIIWNVGHLVSATQLICYKRSGLPVNMDEQLFAGFLPNSKPEKFIDEAAIESINQNFISDIGRLQSDYDNNIFTNYTKSENIERYYGGIELLNIDDAIDFLLYHDGYHAGRILSIKNYL